MQKLQQGDLNATHIGQYIRLTVTRPLNDGSPRETFLIGALVGVSHKVEPLAGDELTTEVTVEIGAIEVPVPLPLGDGEVAIAGTLDELIP